MIFGLFSDNFGADLVSFWVKLTVTVNFLLLVLKCLKFNCFMLQKPKIKCKVLLRYLHSDPQLRTLRLKQQLNRKFLGSEMIFFNFVKNATKV